MSVRFDTVLHRKLAIVAASRGLSLNDLVTTGLAEWLSEQPETAGATRLASRAARLTARNQ